MYSSMNDMPVGTPEQPGLFAIGKANFMQNMKDPVKNKLATAMMGNALNQMGRGFFGASPMGGGRPKAPGPQFDSYGNVLG